MSDRTYSTANISRDALIVTPRRAKELMLTYLRAGLVPFLKGSPGMGKSALVAAVFKEMNWYMRDHRMSTSLPEDMNGLPNFKGEGKDMRASFIPFDIFPLESDPVPEGYNGHGLFLDEFNSAERQVQATSYKLILDFMVGQFRIHPETAIVLAGNLDTDNAIVNEISTALQSRVATILMKPELKEWLHDVAYPQDFAEEVISYVNFAGKVEEFDPNHTEETFMCPRTLEFLSDTLKQMQEGEGGRRYNPDVDGPLAAGVIGATNGFKFNTFMRVYTEIPDYMDIVNDPATAKMPQDKDAQWAIMGSIGKNFVLEDKHLRPVLQYTDRFPAEMKIMLLRMLREKHPDIRTDRDFVMAVTGIIKHLNGKPLFKDEKGL